MGHGSRDPNATAAFEALVAAFAPGRGERVRHAYVELAQPLLDEALEEAARESQELVLTPLFLFTAPHVKNDLPVAVARARARHPDVTFSVSSALGVHPAMIGAFWDRIAVHVGSDSSRTALIVVGRGASDPDANGELYKLARMVAERRGLASLDVCFAGISQPTLEDALERATRMRPARVIVAPYLLFGGRIYDKLHAITETFAARTPWVEHVLSEPLADHPGVLATLRERVGAAQRGEGLLPCDTCQYRQPIGAVVEKVGGLRALLWSVRHSVTHAQAAPHVHGHRPLTKHVLVCANGDCVDRGSMAVLTSMRRELKQLGREREIRVTRTGCMGRCGEGPAVVVYPDGIWYRGVHEADVHDVVREHLLGERIVARLVDNIMA